MNRLILGDGLLGSELIKQTGWDYISRNKDGIDFTVPETYNYLIAKYDQVINCIGYTDTYDSDKTQSYNVNYIGVTNLIDICNKSKTKLIHISSDYVYANSVSNASEEDIPSPCTTWYGYYKVLSDEYIKLKCKDYLIFRSCHKPEPFTFEKAYCDLIGNFDYVSNIVPLMIKLIEKNKSGLYNIGTEQKTMYELALRTKTDVMPVHGLLNDSMPVDVTMNLTKLKGDIDEF